MPIASPFLKTDGESVLVDIPSMSDMLADKLTAFAPNTTGIPYYKKCKNGENWSCSLEIAKQMYDVASLFDSMDNFEDVLEIYKRIANVESEYRQMPGLKFSEILMDSINTSFGISTRGTNNKRNYEMLVDGIFRLQDFIYNNRYTVDSAITDSAKVVYLSACLMKGIFVAEKYDLSMADIVQKAIIDKALDSDLMKWTKLNKLKKSNLEAFYYWYRTFELLKNVIPVTFVFMRKWYYRRDFITPKN